MQSAVPYPGKVIRNPVNRPDPIRKRFGYGQFMAITASVQPESGRIVYAGSDFSHPFQPRFFRRRYGSYCGEPTRIRSGWPGQVLAKRICSVLSPQTSRIILCKTSLGPIQFWLTVPGFGPNGSGPEASQCVQENHPARFWPTFPSRSGPDANRIRHVYWANFPQGTMKY